jgi:NADH:ubiquinone reductase (H+-translocating)
MRDAPRVVIIGAGFAGLSAGSALSGHGFNVTIVDRHNFNTFQPLLYQVATAGLDSSDVAYPVRATFARKPDVMFRRCTVVSIDFDAKSIMLGDATVLLYDYLIVATGATAGFFNIQGAAEKAHPLYTLADARALRNMLLELLEDSEAHPERHDGGAPCIAVVGGGPTGVETAGALIELLAVARKHDHVNVDWDRTKVVLLDATDRLLTTFHERAGAYAEKTLRKRGVEVRLSCPVVEVTDTGLLFGNGLPDLRADLVIWAGGVTVDGTLASTFHAKTGRGGRVEVSDDLRLADRHEVFVVGDSALVPRGPGMDASPQLAQVAIQSGRHAAEQVIRLDAGQQTVAFRYHDKGQMATIGRRAAVAQLTRGPVIGGFLGWAAWLGLHLVYLMGFRNRLVVAINWTWRYFAWPSGPRVIIMDEHGT